MRSVLLLLLVLATPAAAQEPLHRQIDALVAAQAGGEVRPPASDAAFVRRVYLDLAGRIPRRDEVQAFLDDAGADKRAKLIDALLASPEHPRHLADVFHVMLTERLGEHEEWHGWLLASLEANKPWDQMAREMLAPHLEDDPARGAGLFLAKRLENYGQNPVDYPALVRDVGRLLLGVDLQCAQCHDHPLIDDYKQVDYQGLYAYFANVSLGAGKYPGVKEAPTTQKIAFQSVFIMEPEEVGLRLPFGVETMIPPLEKGQEFELPPDKATNHPGVLKFSPLRLLAQELPRAETPGFSRNIANRLWWLMLGRGLVEPLDQHHAGNPPSHPELLDRLASELAAHQFDLRWFLKELALSQTYQRSSELPGDAEQVPATSYRAALEKGLTPEQLARSLLTATGPWPESDKKWADLKERCVKALGQPPREPETEFAPSVKGALFLSHDRAILALLERHDGNLMDRLSKLDDTAAADELFLSVLSRLPDEEERRELAERLASGHTDRTRLLRRYVWAMLTSNEFCLNH